MADGTETQGTTPQSDPSPQETTAFESHPDSMPPVIRGWHARPATWQVQFTSPSRPTPSQTVSSTASQTASQTVGNITRASPLTTEDDLNLLRIAVHYKDRFTTMKGNAVLYGAIAKVWRADTGRKINHQTVHKHITDRLKEHRALISIPETSRPKMNATEAAIFDHANEIYEVLQEKSVAEAQRKGLVDELVPRGRDKRPREPENYREGESERPTARPRPLPPSPAPASPSLQTEMALFLSMMNSRAAIEASTGVKKEDITRLEARIDSMAATMEGMMALLRTLSQRPPRPN